MRCPLIGNYDGRWGKSNSPVPVDFWVCPVAVPTLNFGAERSMLTIGASAEKQMYVDPESTMPVAVVSRLIGKDLFRVGLKLA